MVQRDHYIILGVSPTAPTRSIQRAFRPLAKQYHPDRVGPQGTSKYLIKNNFIFFSEVLEHVFHVVNQMRPAFIRIELYPFVFDKAPQYFYTIQFWRIFWKIKDV